MDLFSESEEIVTFTVEGKGKLENFLYCKDISKRLFRKLYKKRHIYVNGQVGKRNQRLVDGDLVSIYMEDEENEFELEEMDLDIIYEDYDLLVLNKPPHVVVHPTKSHQSNTISNGIAYYFHQKGLKRKIRFVNRLDMNTSGILVVAKNPFAHQQVSLQFERNSVEKKYKALVSHRMEKDGGVISSDISKKSGDLKSTVDREDGDTLTSYSVIERYRDASLIDIRLYTGKTHQIRVHLSSIGHPIIGDSLYGEESTYIGRQALQSYYLKLENPRSKEDIELSIGMPDDFKMAIEKLKHMSVGKTR